MAFHGCIAGLGNPGPQYAGNRHNLGFMTLDAAVLSSRRSASSGPAKSSSQGDAQTFDVSIPGFTGRILAVKPLTFMNLSGFAVSRLLRYYKIPLESFLLVHDELDLPLGRIKLKRGGGDAGHNGVASVIEQLGTADFYRLRLGVGRPLAGRDAAGYVLADFSQAERASVERVLAAAAEAAFDFFRLGATRATARINVFDARPEVAPPLPGQAE